MALCFHPAGRDDIYLYVAAARDWLDQATAPQAAV